MKNSRGMKKSITLLLALILIVSNILPLNAFAGTSSAQKDGTFTNPVIWADVPDPSVIRVGDAFYMSSTTMHLSPGVPIMKSYDLVNWEIVNYVYDIMEDTDALNLKNGSNAYSNGSWASSLRYSDGTFYLSFMSYTTGRTYIYQTEDIEKGTWRKYTLWYYNEQGNLVYPAYHDMSLLIDDEIGNYMVYGGTQAIKLNDDLTNVDPASKGVSVNLFSNTDEMKQSGLTGDLFEGAHVYKIGEYYYVFIITWSDKRSELCFRTKDFLSGEWEVERVLHSVLSDTEGNTYWGGVAQGGIVETENGDWYGMLFQDRGSAGRIPVLVPVTWENDWPMMGVDGAAPAQMDIPVAVEETLSGDIVKSDEFYNDAEYRNMVPEDCTLDPQAPAGEDLSASENTGKELIVNGDFETGEVTPWFGKQSASIEINSQEAYSGNYSLYISNREGTGSGPQQTVKIVPGGTYRICAKVKYEGENAPASRAFNVTAQKGTSGWDFDDMVTGVIQKGEWGTVEGVYTFSEEFPIMNNIFVETSWTAEQDPVKDLMDFYVDDISIIEESIPAEEVIINGGLEDGLEPWTGNDNAVVSLSDEIVFNGNYSIFATGRTTTGSGPMQYITGKVIPGAEYKVSAQVYYEEGPDNKLFQICIRNGSSWQGIEIMAGATIRKGEWGIIEGTYKIPEDADISETSIFLETVYASAPHATNDLMDFYADDISMVKVFEPEPNPEPTDEHDYNGSNLDLVWQWNHNPDNRYWSLTERPGYLRLTTGRVDSGIEAARNTLTQRTYGPTSSGQTAIEVSGMKNGDVAGLAAFAWKYAYAGVKMENGQKYIVMNYTTIQDSQTIEAEAIRIPLNQDRVYFKVDLDYMKTTDKAYFYYSFNGVNWNSIGEVHQMEYRLEHFMGYRFALFNYAAEEAGGYVDFDYFRVSDDITGAENTANIIATKLQDTAVDAAIGMEVEVPVTMDALPDGKYSQISASFNIPSQLRITDVNFNKANITGNTSYTYDEESSRLYLSVTGESLKYINSIDDIFAVIKLEVAESVTEPVTYKLSTDYIRVEGGNVEINTHDARANIRLRKLDINTIAKQVGNSNPLVTHKFGADPYALEYEGRVYIYSTNDSQALTELNASNGKYEVAYGNIVSINIISSADMVNWTDHGSVPVAGRNSNGEEGIAKWATNSWAPAAVHKVIDGVDKFFLYYCNNASGVGVLEADSPVGPWRDPRGKALVDSTTLGVGYTANDPNADNPTVWIFDPAVLLDDDGTGYLYFGGGVPTRGEYNSVTQEDANHPKTARVIKLGDDMVSLAYETDSSDPGAIMIDALCMFENSGIHKYNGKYYYSYCTNFSGQRYSGYPGNGQLCYMVSDSPTGPFEFVGMLMDNPSVFFGTGGNNHHAVFPYQDRWYITYHAKTVEKSMVEQGLKEYEQGYRSTHINEIFMNADGTVKEIIGDYAGVTQLAALNPYQLNEAETIGWHSGLDTSVIETTALEDNVRQTVNLQLTSIHDSDWLALGGVDFGPEGAARFTARVAAKVGGQIELRLDGLEGELIGTLDVSPTGGENQYTEIGCEVRNATGEHTLFMVFLGYSEDNLFNMDNWKFTERSDDNLDYEELDRQIQEVERIDRNKYTYASWNVVQDALSAAYDIKGISGSTQADVDGMVKALKDSVAGLTIAANDPWYLEYVVELADDLKEEADLAVPIVKNMFYNAYNAADALANRAREDARSVALSDTEDTALYLLRTFKWLSYISGDTGILEEILDKAKDILNNKDKYTEESIVGLQELVDEAEELLKKENLLDEEIIEMGNRLEEAVNNVKEKEETEKTDKSLLLKLIEEAKEILASEGKYIPSSIAGLKNVLDEAQEVYDDDNADKDSVKAAIKALTLAINKARLAPNKDDLEKLADKASRIDRSLYTQASLKVLDAALNAARFVLEDPEADEEKVSEAVAALQTALRQLELKEEFKPDKSALEKLVKEASALNKDSYTKDSWNNLQTALLKAKEVLDSNTAQQNDVDEAYKLLKEAMEALKEVDKQNPEPPITGETDETAGPSNNAGKVKGAKTGDSNSFIMLIVLMSVSGILIAGWKRKVFKQ